MLKVLRRSQDLSYGLHWQREQWKGEHWAAELEMKRTYPIIHRDIKTNYAILDNVADYTYNRDDQTRLEREAKRKLADLHEDIDYMLTRLDEWNKKIRKIDIEIAVVDARNLALEKVLNI